MKRLFGLLGACALLTGLAVLTPTTASADTDACAGTGTATLETGLGYPVLWGPNTANFTFAFTAGVCVEKGLQSGQLFAHGTVTGNCGLSTGTGLTFNGHEFSFTSTGTVLVLTGGVTGVVSAAPDPTTGSCTAKAATRFFITGSVTKTH